MYVKECVICTKEILSNEYSYENKCQDCLADELNQVFEKREYTKKGIIIFLIIIAITIILWYIG